MDSFEIWRLCDKFSIVQAALLAIDVEPSVEGKNVETKPIEERPPGYEAMKYALVQALQAKQISGNLVRDPARVKTDAHGMNVSLIASAVHLHQSSVEVASLGSWLDKHGIENRFFSLERTATRAYLDPDSPRYAPKLDAAVRAWEAMDNPHLLSGKTPKTALMNWIRQHATELGLVGENGRPNQTAIEEVAKVANWNPKGGAPKTSG